MKGSRKVAICATILMSAAPAMLGVQRTVYGKEILQVMSPIQPGVGVAGESLETMIKEFEAATGVTVKVTTPGYFEYSTKFMTAVAGGAPPDVVWTTEGRTWGRKGLLIPLDPLISKSKVVNWDDFFGAPKMYSEDSRTGHVYAIPLQTDARVIAWNKEVYGIAGLPEDHPPVYWDELLEYSKRLTRFNSENQLEVAGFDFRSEGQWFGIWMGTAGGRMWDEATTPPVAVPDLDIMVRALDFGASVIRVLGGWESSQAHMAKYGDTPASLRDHVAMAIVGSWQVKEVRTQFPDLSLGISYIPIERNNGKRFTLSGGDCLAIPNGARNVGLAWRFIEFLTGTDRIARWASMNGYIPPRKSAAELWNFQQWPQNVLLSAAMYGAPWPDTYGATYDYQQAFRDVISGKSSSRDAALRTKQAMQAAANKFFSKK